MTIEIENPQTRRVTLLNAAIDEGMSLIEALAWARSAEAFVHDGVPLFQVSAERLALPAPARAQPSTDPETEHDEEPETEPAADADDEPEIEPTPESEPASEENSPDTAPAPDPSTGSAPPAPAEAAEVKPSSPPVADNNNGGMVARQQGLRGRVIGDRDERAGGGADPLSPPRAKPIEMRDISASRPLLDSAEAKLLALMLDRPDWLPWSVIDTARRMGVELNVVCHARRQLIDKGYAERRGDVPNCTYRPLLDHDGNPVERASK